METEHEGLVALKDVAGRYGVSRRTLDYWAAAGRLTTIKFQRERRVYAAASELEALIAEPPSPKGGWMLGRKRVV